MSVKKIIADMKRVWKVTKKPSKKDYMLTLKIVTLGFLFVGTVGFLVEMLWFFLLSKAFS